MEMISKKDGNLTKTKNFNKNEKIRRYKSNYYRYKKKYKKVGDLRETILLQCIVCSIFLLIMLSFNYIDNELTRDFRYKIKNLITEDIKKAKVIYYFNIVSDKFNNISKTINNRYKIKNDPNKEAKTVFKNKGEIFRIDEDILDEINEKEKNNKECSFYTKVDGKIWLNPGEGIITSLFGKRINPISKKEEFHNGIDIYMEENTDILAIRDGIVTDISFSNTFGNILKYKTDDNYEIMYAHLNSLNVNIGDKIKQGDIVALSGNTGLTTGPHLHFTIWKEKELIDPIDYLKLPFTENIKKELEKREGL